MAATPKCSGGNVDHASRRTVTIAIVIPVALPTYTKRLSGRIVAFRPRATVQIGRGAGRLTGRILIVVLIARRACVATASCPARIANTGGGAARVIAGGIGYTGGAGRIAGRQALTIVVVILESRIAKTRGYSRGIITASIGPTG